MMQTQIRTKAIPVRFGEEDVRRIDLTLTKSGARSRSEFIREAVLNYLDNVAEMKIIELRSISKGQAKEEILRYLNQKREAETFEIANDLRLDVALVVRALKELWDEGRVR